MAWQGIPFLLQQDKLQESVHVALSSIPKIVIESPPDYTNAWITAGVSLLAGAIPALIAIWTFKRNSENIKLEREKQQEFLREERSNHQEFLKSDREKQQQSFEEDRKTQIAVAKTNFNMEVLSANRQAWINTLREITAEYYVEAVGLVDEAHTCAIDVDYLRGFHDIIKNNDNASKNNSFNENYEEARQDVFSSRARKQVRDDKVTLLSAKISMMLNPNEVEYHRVKSIFNEIRSIVVRVTEAKGDNKAFQIEISKTIDLMNSLVDLMQSLLKKEWARVKSGV